MINQEVTKKKMTELVNLFLVAVILIVCYGEVTGQGSAQNDTLTHSELAQQINDPTAPLSLVLIKDIIVLDYPGYSGIVNILQVQPVIPIKTKHLPLQLIKATFPILSLPDTINKTNIGDFQIFDLLTFKQKWGRWGAGVAMIFPTGSTPDFGSGKWQVGPAVALFYTGSKILVAGAIFQNVVSFAGDANMPKVNTLLITPTITFTSAKGWFGGFSDFDITIDWENKEGVIIPLGLQAGKVFKVNKIPLSLSLEAAANATHSAQTPSWMMAIEFNVIF